MKHILAFGDSNTWGLVPGSKCQERYPQEIRWTGILQNKFKNAGIIEEGLCGRTTVFEDEQRPGRKGVALLPAVLETHQPLDAVIIMLGTNDCKSVYNASAATIGQGMEMCLDVIEKYISPEKILLVSPIHLGRDVWREDKDPAFGQLSVETCKNLKGIYSKIAKKRGTAFIAASEYAYPSDIDAEHLDEEGHKKLAYAIYESLCKIIADD